MNSNPVKLIQIRKFCDDRGWLAETFQADRLSQQGVTSKFVQDNHSYSRLAGTIRGVHFQRPPHAQNKLVRCTRGRIIDYAIDLRKGSPTFGQYVAAELSAKNGDQLFVPIGFGHAFITLEPDCEVIYKVSDFYAPDFEGGIRWDCPSLAIGWPLPTAKPTLSSKDELLPLLEELDSPFAYDGNPLQPL